MGDFSGGGDSGFSGGDGGGDSGFSGGGVAGGKGGVGIRGSGVSTGGVAIGIAVLSAGGDGGDGIGDSCRLATVVCCTVIDFERVVSMGFGSIRSLSKSSTRRNDDRNSQIEEIPT